MTRLKLSLLPLLLLAITTYNSLNGQDIDNKFQFRSAAGFSKEIVRELKFTVTPELRFNWGSGLDKFMLTNEFEYDVLSSCRFPNLKF